MTIVQKIIDKAGGTLGIMREGDYLYLCKRVALTTNIALPGTAILQGKTVFTELVRNNKGVEGVRIIGSDAWWPAENFSISDQ